MAVSEDYSSFVLEQLGRVTPVTGKSMFGGMGIYAKGLFFALIAENRLYFKVDELTRLEFERHGMEPFRPFGEERAMGYYELPCDVLEDPTRLAEWTLLALAVAAKAKSAKASRSSPQAGIVHSKEATAKSSRKRLKKPKSESRRHRPTQT